MARCKAGATQSRRTAVLHPLTGPLEVWGAGFQQAEPLSSKLRKHQVHASNLTCGTITPALRTRQNITELKDHQLTDP